MIEVNESLRLDERELRFEFVASAGPGGQNVNKVATRAILYFDVAHSAALSDVQRTRIMQRLSHRISGDGVLRMTCGRHRSQAANRRTVTERFRDLLRAALTPPRPRRPTRPTRASVERRLTEKSRRAEKKHRRARRSHSDGD